MRASWIRSKIDTENMSPCFVRELNIKKAVKKAYAKVSAIGVYELLVNGCKVGNAIMCPGWTSEPHRTQYQTYDITALLQKDNEIGILCGKGWALSRLTWSEFPYLYADHVSAVAEITVEYDDGTSETVATDETWQVYTSQISDSELYHGEVQDLTQQPAWLCPAVADDTVHTTLVPQEGEYVVERERVAAKSLIKTPKGETVIDFGQNLAGYVEVKIKGRAGEQVAFSHAEVLDKDGNFYTENYRTCESINRYTLSGGEDVLKPKFCFQGYRYIKLIEFPYEIGEEDLDLFTSVAVYSNIRQTAKFRCGNKKINRLYENVVWGQRSNFFDIPTDCPQRDERFGWTGDAQVFCKTAAINYDVEKFFKKWLSDVMLEQEEDGAIRGFVPGIPKCPTWVSAAWADAATVCPWEIYLAYGDKELLRRHYPMMKKWVEYMHHIGDEEFLWIGGTHYSDWFAMDAGEGIYKGATQTDLIASAFFAYSTELCIKAGRVLGEDTSYHEELFKNVKAAFRNAFMRDGMPVVYPKADAFSKDREVRGVTQTSLILILHFGLCTEQERPVLAKRLVELIRENGTRISTGFVGTPYILHTLSENGYTDVAYDLLLQEKNPSWLYPVNHGATTIWEHWDGIKENGDFWASRMNSFNHYAFGCVFDWIFCRCAGIAVREDGAGYSAVDLSPNPHESLGFVDASIDTRAGTVKSLWEINEDNIRYEFTVPKNCKAYLTLPDEKTRLLTEGSYLFVREKA